MLDNFSPTTAIVGTKANFSLLSCYGDIGIRDGREIVVESVLEPQPVNGHYSPTGIISICSLRPIIATTDNETRALVVAGPLPRSVISTMSRMNCSRLKKDGIGTATFWTESMSKRLKIP